MPFQKINLRLALFIFLILAGSALLFYLQNRKFDARFTDKISIFDAAQWETQAYRQSLKKTFDENNYRASEGVIVDFRIGEDDIAKMKGKFHKLEWLFRNKLVDEVLFLTTGAVLFKLKFCMNQDCSEGRADGIYTHYLIKDQTLIIQEEWAKITEQKKVGDWTYYIIRTPMG